MYSKDTKNTNKSCPSADNGLLRPLKQKELLTMLFLLIKFYSVFISIIILFLSLRDLSYLEDFLNLLLDSFATTVLLFRHVLVISSDVNFLSVPLKIFL